MTTEVEVPQADGTGAVQEPVNEKRSAAEDAKKWVDYKHGIPHISQIVGGGPLFSTSWS